MIDRVRRILYTNKSLSLISSGLSATLGLLTFGLLARSFTISDLGFWGFFISVYTLFDMLRTGMVSSALIKNINECESEGEIAEVIGSGWKLSLIVTLIGGAVVSLLFYLIFLFNNDDSYRYLFRWFGAIALVSIPHSMAIWTLSAYQKFGKIFWVRLILQGGFLSAVIYQFYYQPGLNYVLLVYLLANLLTGIFTMVMNWNKISWLRRGSAGRQRSLYHFGKYTMGTSVASNLLRSSDTFIIMGLLGPAYVASYNVAERILGLFDIPLRSFVVTAFPRLVKRFSSGLKSEFRDEFESGAGFSLLMLFPVSLVAFLFAEPLVVALAGEQYVASAGIVRVFAVYTVLTPLDRFSGIALDVINRPDLNFYKVLIMLLANIIGDYIVLQFTDSLTGVALVSIVTFSTGIVVGFVMLKDHLRFQPLSILAKGWGEIRRIVEVYLK